MHHPEVIGHRGAPLERLENTLSSFLRALELGADAIELDVHGTADGVVVVHHDPVVHVGERGAGRRPIARLTAGEIAEIELRDGERIPTLDETLEAIGRRAVVYVEVKARGIEQLVVDAVRRAQTECAVHCFDHRVVRRVQALAPELPTGILVAAYLLDPGRTLREAGARDYWLEWTFVDEELVRRIHDVGGRVIAWTANGRANAEALAAMGVDALCTDTIPEVLAVAERVA